MGLKRLDTMVTCMKLSMMSSAEQHHVIMIRELVGDRHCSGPFDGVHQAIVAAKEGVVVDLSAMSHRC